MEANDDDNYDLPELQTAEAWADVFKGLTSQSSGYHQIFSNIGSGSQQQTSSSSQVSSLSQQMEIVRRVDELNNDCKYISESSNNNNNNCNSSTNNINNNNNHHYHQYHNDSYKHGHSIQTATNPNLTSSQSASLGPLVIDHLTFRRHCEMDESDSVGDDISSQWIESRNSLNEHIESLLPIFLKHLCALGEKNKYHQHEQTSLQRQHERRPRKPLGNNDSLTNRQTSNDLNANYQTPSTFGVSSLPSSSRLERVKREEEGEENVAEQHNESAHKKINLLLTMNLDPIGGMLSLENCSIVELSTNLNSAKVTSPLAAVGTNSDIESDKRQTQTKDTKPTIYRRKKKMRQSAPRTHKSPEQLSYLEEAFERSHFLNSDEREYLSYVTGLSDSQIRLWFQYKRNKMPKFCQRASASTG